MRESEFLHVIHFTTVLIPGDPMYQFTCKISLDENQIVTNERTITVNWIGLTSFQEISGNGERCKSVKQADAKSEWGAAGNLGWSKEGFAHEQSKKKT